MVQNTEFDGAIIAAKENHIHEWVLSFLRASGRNPNLAAILEKDTQYHMGPLDYPIDKIINIIGPDETYKYQEDKETFNTRVAKMVSDINKGWQPPPLIATNLWEDYFEISDGGHRQRALLQAGVKVYPTVFYFRDKPSMDSFLDQLQ